MVYHSSGVKNARSSRGLLHSSMLVSFPAIVGSVSSAAALAFPAETLLRRLTRLLITLPFILMMTAPAQSSGIGIRSPDAIATGPCGTIVVKLRSAGSAGIRVMGYSKQRATIIITTDKGVQLQNCPMTKQTCYATWSKRSMRLEQNVVTTTAITPNNCEISISSYIDVH